MIPTRLFLGFLISLCACEMTAQDEDDDETPADGDSTTGVPPGTTTDEPVTTDEPDATTGGNDSTGGPDDPTGGNDSSGGTGDPPSGVWADFDGDGVLDVVTYTSYAEDTFNARATVYSGAAMGATPAEALLVVDGPANGTNQAAVCDVDGDQLADIVMGGENPAVNPPGAIVIRHFDGTMTTVATLQQFFDVLCQDFDGDGHDDIVLGSYGNPAEDASAQIVSGASITPGRTQTAVQTPIGEANGFTVTNLYAGYLDGATPHLVAVEPTADDMGMPGVGVVSTYRFADGVDQPELVGTISGEAPDSYFGDFIRVCDTDGDGVDEITELRDSSIRTWSNPDGSASAPDVDAALPLSLTYGACEPQTGHWFISTGSNLTAIMTMEDGTPTTIVETDEVVVLEVGGYGFGSTADDRVVKFEVDVSIAGSPTAEWVEVVSDASDGPSISTQVLPPIR